MLTVRPLHDLLSVEKLPQQEREDGHVIPGAMLPFQPLLRETAGRLLLLTGHITGNSN